jgi:AcrR family transcriptional regulator
MSALNRAYEYLGYGAKSLIARRCGVTPGAVRRWFADGVLPSTEITEIRGQRITSYGEIIQALTDGAITDDELRNEIFASRASKSVA